MTEIITSIVPGHYTTGQTLTITFPVDSRRAIITRGDRPPVFSEVLAYDTGPIIENGPDVQRPFIAITQDGRGNVVYDGGCPKYANYQIRDANGGVFPETNPDTVEALYPSQRYLYNAFNFCANKRKVANGNRKILLVGNTFRTEPDVVTDSYYNPVPGQYKDGLFGYRDTLDGIALAGNWDITYYEVADINSKIDLSFDYIDEFAAVIFFSIAALPNMANSRVTERFCKDLALYRMAGNGIAIITDHCGANYTDIEDALINGSLFATDAIRVSAEFGCYFSGDVLRSPILVSEIKRQIGLPGPPETHPLLDGLADDSTIYGGPSESIVIPDLYTNDLVDHTQPYVVQMDTAGIYRINVLVQLDDGTILTKPMKFVIIEASDITIHDSLNKIITDSTNTYKRFFDYSLMYDTAEAVTLRGEIVRNGKPQGYFLLQNNNLTYYPFVGPTAPMLVNNNDVIGFRITQPFEYSIGTTISLVDGKMTFEKSGAISTFLGAIKILPNYNDATYAMAMADTVRTGNRGYMSLEDRTRDIEGNWFEQMKRARKPFSTEQLTPGNMWIASDQSDWNTIKPDSPIGAASIIANTNEVYYYCELCLDWRLHSDKANTLFGLGRQILDKRTNKLYIVNDVNTTLVS